MTTKLKIVFFLFIIGVFQPNFIKTETTTLENNNTALAVIEDYTKIEINVENNAKNFAETFEELGERLKNSTNKILKIVHAKLDQGLKLVDTKIEQLIHYNLTDETCGILTFSQAVKGAFSLVENCIFARASAILIKFMNIFKVTMDLSDNLLKVVETEKSCLSSNETKHRISCMKTDNNTVYDLQQKLLKTYHTKEINKFLDLFPPTALKLCLVVNSVNGIINLGIEKKTCLEEKAPRFMAAVHKVIEFRDFTTNLISQKVDEFNKKLKLFVENIKNKIKSSLEKTKNFFSRRKD